MRREEIQTLIEKKLCEQQSAGSPVTDVYGLARSVTLHIMMDRSLAGISADLLGRILDMEPRACSFREITDRIAKYKEGSDDERPGISERDRESLNWGFFLKCWFAFRDSQDVTSIGGMTLRFAAAWLLQRMEFIDEEEAEWCCQTARDHATGIPDKEWRDAEYNAVRDQAVVFVVMRKFLVKYWTQPEAVEAFIGDKKARYEEFVRRQYGIEATYETAVYKDSTGIASPLKTIKPIKKEQYPQKNSSQRSIP